MTQKPARAVDLDTTVLPIDDVRPYWRNPRKITDRAVSAVADSIERYGYNQPIVVDSEHVVIVGHTRLQALRRLDWTHIPVIVRDLSPEDAKAYRVKDNATGDLAEWDDEKLLLELREWTDLDDARALFPALDLTTEFTAGFSAVTDAQVDKAAARISPDQVTRHDEAPAKPAEPAKTILSITCPHCFETIEVDPGT